MFAEDLRAFLKDFGVSVVFTRLTVPVVTTLLIYDAPTSHLAVHDRSFYDAKFYEASSQGSHITLLGVEADLAAVAINDKATVGAVDLYVVEQELDGTGMVTIHLSGSQV